MLGALSALAPLSIDARLPALPLMARDLHAADWLMQATLGAFMLAFALGRLFFGPLSDRIGRRAAILWGLAVYIAAGVACTFSQSAWVLVLARIVQGLGACAGATVTPAIVRDVIDDRARAASLQGYITVVISVAPIVAPLIGAAILPLGWRAIYGFLALSGVALFALAFFGLRETLRERTPHSVASAYKQFLKLPRSVALMGVVGFAFGAYFCYISGSPFVLQHQLGLTPTAFSIAFAVNASLLIVGSFTGGSLARRVGPERLLATGIMLMALTGAATFVMGAHASAPAFIVLMSAYAFAYGLSIPQAYAIGLHEAASIAGTASATLGAGQQLGGSIGSTVVGTLPFIPSMSVGASAAFGGVAALVAYLFSRRGRAAR